MHREYRPDHMHHGEDGAFGFPIVDHEHDERALIAFTALLGGLIGADLILGVVGWDRGRFPMGLSPAMIAALFGAVYIVYGTLRSLLQGRIGADLALAQACLAALMIGQPFVAAEVVFIALLGEVLEAVTFARTRRALGRTRRADAAHGARASRRRGDRDPGASGRHRRSGRREGRRSCPR